jgi:adenosine deaminase
MTVTGHGDPADAGSGVEAPYTDIADVDNDWSAQERGPLDRSAARATLARRLPRAELHVHLSGALRSSFAGRAVGRRGPDAELDYVDVESFFQRHKEISRSLSTPDALRRAVEHVVIGAVDSGCRHIEISVNRSEFGPDGVGVDTALDALGQGMTDTLARYGISGGLILAMDRNSDPESALDTVARAAAARDRGVPVLGVGNDGSPSRPLRRFAPAFEQARRAGLRTTAHANKPIDVVEALELDLDRIDHAWELQDQVELQQRLVASGTPVTMALTSCLIMLPGRFPSAVGFPFEQLRRAGVAVTLNVDDSAMFFTDSAQEYRLAADTWDWDDTTLAEVALASLEAAWIADDREARLQAWRDEARALVADPRHPTMGGRP